MLEELVKVVCAALPGKLVACFFAFVVCEILTMIYSRPRTCIVARNTYE